MIAMRRTFGMNSNVGMVRYGTVRHDTMRHASHVSDIPIPIPIPIAIAIAIQVPIITPIAHRPSTASVVFSLSHRADMLGSCSTTSVYPSLGATRISSFRVRMRTKEMFSSVFDREGAEALLASSLSSSSSSLLSSLLSSSLLSLSYGSSARGPDRLRTYWLADFIIWVRRCGFPSMDGAAVLLPPPLPLASADLARSAPAVVTWCVTMLPWEFNIDTARTPLWEANRETVS
mmetsp:Transcript_3562/g.10033  ORF Transcript_3562/g.10033 Transcript_3562/m.10033 type:complete len:232 (-) Transcript_3562:393-1088(-)